MERIITPVIKSYLNKYFLNVPDLRLSIWGGDVVLNNLELRLEVLEKELLKGVASVLSIKRGFIRALRIHIPWTQLTYQSIQLDINTIELIVTSKKPEDTQSNQPTSPTNANTVPNDPVSTAEKTDNFSAVSAGLSIADPVGVSQRWVQPLLMKITSNVEITISNLILKYIEDDIAVTLSCKLIKLLSALPASKASTQTPPTTPTDIPFTEGSLVPPSPEPLSRTNSLERLEPENTFSSTWKREFVEPGDNNLLSKICHIEGLTLCIDRYSSQGKVHTFQDPVINRVNASVRVMMFMNETKQRMDQQPLPAKRVDVTFQSLDITFTDSQLAMLRVILDKITLAWKKRPKKKKIYKPLPPPQPVAKPSPDVPKAQPQPAEQTGWLSWAWSLVEEPDYAINDNEANQADATPSLPTEFHWGFFIQQARVAFKRDTRDQRTALEDSAEKKFLPVIQIDINSFALEFATKVGQPLQICSGLRDISVYYANDDSYPLFEIRYATPSDLILPRCQEKVSVDCLPCSLFDDSFVDGVFAPTEVQTPRSSVIPLSQNYNRWKVFEGINLILNSTPTPDGASLRKVLTIEVGSLQGVYNVHAFTDFRHYLSCLKSTLPPSKPKSTNFPDARSNWLEAPPIEYNFSVLELVIYAPLQQAPQQDFNTPAVFLHVPSIALTNKDSIVSSMTRHLNSTSPGQPEEYLDHLISVTGARVGCVTELVSNPLFGSLHKEYLDTTPINVSIVWRRKVWSQNPAEQLNSSFQISSSSVEFVMSKSHLRLIGAIILASRSHEVLHWSKFPFTKHNDGPGSFRINLLNIGVLYEAYQHKKAFSLQLGCLMISHERDCSCPQKEPAVIVLFPVAFELDKSGVHLHKQAMDKALELCFETGPAIKRLFLRLTDLFIRYDAVTAEWIQLLTALLKSNPKAAPATLPDNNTDPSLLYPMQQKWATWSTMILDAEILNPRVMITEKHVHFTLNDTRHADEHHSVHNNFGLVFQFDNLIAKSDSQHTIALQHFKISSAEFLTPSHQIPFTHVHEQTITDISLQCKIPSKGSANIDLSADPIHITIHQKQYQAIHILLNALSHAQLQSQQALHATLHEFHLPPPSSSVKKPQQSFSGFFDMEVSLGVKLPSVELELVTSSPSTQPSPTDNFLLHIINTALTARGGSRSTEANFLFDAIQLHHLNAERPMILWPAKINQTAAFRLDWLASNQDNSIKSLNTKLQMFAQPIHITLWMDSITKCSNVFKAPPAAHRSQSPTKPKGPPKLIAPVASIILEGVTIFLPACLPKTGHEGIAVNLQGIQLNHKQSKLVHPDPANNNSEGNAFFILHNYELTVKRVEAKSVIEILPEYEDPTEAPSQTKSLLVHPFTVHTDIAIQQSSLDPSLTFPVEAPIVANADLSAVKASLDGTQYRLIRRIVKLAKSHQVPGSGKKSEGPPPSEGGGLAINSQLIAHKVDIVVHEAQELFWVTLQNVSFKQVHETQRAKMNHLLRKQKTTVSIGGLFTNQSSDSVPYVLQRNASAAANNPAKPMFVFQAISIKGAKNVKDVRYSCEVQPVLCSVDLQRIEQFIAFMKFDTPDSVIPASLPIAPSAAPSFTQTPSTLGIKIVVEQIDINVLARFGPDNRNYVLSLSANQAFAITEPREEITMSPQMASIALSSQAPETIPDPIKIHWNVVDLTLSLQVPELGWKSAILQPCQIQSALTVSAHPVARTVSVDLETKLLDIRVGAEHVMVLKSMADVLLKSLKNPAGNNKRAHVPRSTEFHSTNDLREGHFRLISQRDIRPNAGEITFSSDESIMPWMSWRYREPRSLTDIVSNPLPFPVETNSAEVSEVWLCTLYYWDEFQETYVLFHEFSIHESLPQSVTLPNKGIYSYEWQIKLNRRSKESISNAPFSPTVLAISLRVDSTFTADYIPKLRLSVGISLAHLFILHQKLGVTPVEQDFFTISFDDTKSRVGIWNSNLLCSLHTSIQAFATNYHDLTQICVIEKFPFSFIIDKFSESEEQKTANLGTMNIISKSNDTSYRRFLISTTKMEFNLHDTVIHMMVTAAKQFQSALQRKVNHSKPPYSVFYLKNSTTLTLNIGQHSTDEVVTLPPNVETGYSWRTKALRRDLRVWGDQNSFAVVIESALMESEGLHSKKLVYMGQSLHFWILVQSKGRAQHLITFLGTHSITNTTSTPLQVSLSNNAHTEDVLIAPNSVRGIMVPHGIRNTSVMARTVDATSNKPSQWVKFVFSPTLIEFPEVGEAQRGYLPPCYWTQVSDMKGHTSISFSPVFELHNQTSMDLSFRSSHHIISTNDDIIQFPASIPAGGSVTPHINPHHLPLLAFSFHPKTNSEQDLWSYPLSLSGTVIQDLAKRGRPHVQYLDMQILMGARTSPIHVPLMLTIMYSPNDPSAFHLYFSFQCEIINTTEDTLFLRSVSGSQSPSSSPLLQDHNQAPTEQTMEIPSGVTMPCHWNHWSFDSPDGLLMQVGFTIPQASSNNFVMWSDPVSSMESTSRSKERQILVEMRSAYTPAPASPTTMHYQVIVELIPLNHLSGAKGLSTLRVVLRPSVSVLNKTVHTVAIKPGFVDADSAEHPRLIPPNQSIPLNFWTLPKAVQCSLQDLVPMFQLAINKNGSPLTWSKKIETFKTCSRKKVSLLSAPREWIDVSIVAHKGALNVILFKDKPTMTLANHLNSSKQDQTIWYGQVGTEECQPLRSSHPTEYYWYAEEDDQAALVQSLRDDDEEGNDNDNSRTQARAKYLHIKLGEDLDWSPPVEIRSGVQILTIPDAAGQRTVIVNIVMEGSGSIIEFWNDDIFFQHPLSLEAQSKPALNSTVIASVTTDWVFQINFEQISVCWFVSSSVVNNSLPIMNTPVTEILHLVLDNVSVSLRKSTERSLFVRSKVEYLLGGSIESLQIDNQLGQYEFPVMLTSYKSSSGYYDEAPQPVFKISVSLVSSNQHYHIRHLDIDVSSILIRVEDSLLYYLKTLATGIMDSIKYEDFPNRIFVLKEPASGLSPLPSLLDIRVPQAIVDRELTVPLFIEQFRVSAVTIHLTVHATLGLFLGLDRAPVSFEAVELSSIRCSIQSLLNIMMAKYITDALRSTPALVGSLEFLGNPTGFLRNITNGLRDVLMLPMQGLFKGPGAFLIGIQGGTFSLLKNVSEGTFSSVSGLATALARNIDRLSFDDAFITYKQQLRRQRGLGSGVKFLGHGILNGITGVIWKPLEGAYNEGITGFVKGAGKGVLSLLTKPVGGTLDMISNTSQTLLSATVGSNYYHERRRPPKVILGFQYSSVHYHRFLSTDEHMLIKLDVSQVSTTGTSTDGVLILSTNHLYIMSDDAIRTHIDLKDVLRLEESLTDKKLLVIVPKANPQDTTLVKMFFHVHSIPEKSALVVTCQRLLAASQPQLLIPGSV